MLLDTFALDVGRRVELNSAKCLDGTPAVYYIAGDADIKSSKLVIFLEGGGWCLTQRGTPPSGAGGCAARAWAAPGLPNGMLGSTRRAPLSIDPHGSGGAGDLSANASLKPSAAPPSMARVAAIFAAMCGRKWPE